MMKVLFLSIFMLGLTACISNTVITGEATEEVEVSKVKVLYASLPECDFDVIAQIEIPGNYYSRASLVNALREEAAEIGASAVQITYIQQIGASEYLGSARALRCRAD
jgi:hypothetical protein